MEALSFTLLIFTQLVVEPDLNIALSLCEVCPVTDIDDVARVLLTCFESRNQTMHLLRAVIEKEVANTGRFIVRIYFYALEHWKLNIPIYDT